MKKFYGFLILIAYCITFCSVFCTEALAAKEPMYKKIDRIGNQLVEKNNLPEGKIKFKLKKTNKVNAYANMKKEVYVYSGLVKLCDNDDELAGIMGHEVGHIVNNHLLKINAVHTIATTAIEVTNEIIPVAALGGALIYGVSRKKLSRVDEFEADITGVDLMVGAGYNPLAMVSVLQKISQKYVDIISTHPSGEKRTMYVYNYIVFAYPEYIENGYDTKSFAEFMEYAAPIMEERNSNPDKLAKHEEKVAKLHLKRQKKYKKYQKKSEKKKTDEKETPESEL